MVNYILLQNTLALRSTVLRNGQPPETCILPTDREVGCFHLGYFVNEQLVSIATFFPEDHPDYGPGGYRLRGMASDNAFSGKGYGGSVIKFAIDELTSVNASYIWCNTRSTAVGFYTKLGFSLISEMFDVPGIGPHYNMLRKINEGAPGLTSE